MTDAIGIDVGSTNVKVARVDSSGAVRHRAARSLTTRRVGEVIDQDADALWDAVADAVREVVAEDPAGVATIGVCSQYSSIVPVGADARPVAPLVLYLDQRGTPRSWEVLERFPDAFELWIERHGIPPVGGGLSLGHVLHLQHDRPEVHERTAAYLEPMDYIAARLTGRLVANQCTMFMAQLCDNRSLGVTSYDEDLVQRSGVDSSRLPTLVHPREAIGEVRDDVAGELGLGNGVVVSAAMNDSQAGAYATGAFQPGRAGLAMGTTSVLLDTVDRKDTDLDHEVLSMPSPEPDTYLVWAENGMGGKALEHVLEHLVYVSDELADHATADRFAMLDAALEASPPGANGLVFLPWLTGTYSPRADGRMRGAVVNLSLDTRRVDLVRSVVEGTAANAAWLLPIIERFTRTPIDEVVFAGGAARSAGWAQAMADALDRPVLSLRDPDIAVARAVALVALERLGELDAGSARDHVVTANAIEPRADVHEQLRPAREQFVALFDALRPVYHVLNG